MIKAAMVTPNLTLGGAERWLVDLIKHSSPSRIRWTGLAISSFGGCDRQLSEELRPYTRLYANKCVNRPSHAKPFYWPAIDKVTDPNFRSAVRMAVKDADVVLTWGWSDMDYWFDGIDVPRITCSHSTINPSEAGRKVRGLTHLTAVSKAAMHFFDGSQGSDLPKTVLYNGADPQRCQPIRGRKAIRETWGVKGKDIVIGYLGRQSPEKNPIAPAQAIKGAPPWYRAIYHGVGPTGDGFCEKTMGFCRESIPDRWRMFGPDSRVGDILAGYDVLMLASHREAFSLTLIEAWLAGVPVVATPVGSVPELQEQFGELVFSVPVNPSPDELRTAVDMAMCPKLRRPIVDHARDVAWHHFTVDKMVERWTRYLENVVNGYV